MIALTVGGSMFRDYTDAMDKQLIQQVAKQPVSDPNPGAPVTCDHLPMYRDQVCEHTTSLYGSTINASKLSYDEQKQAQKEDRIKQVKDNQMKQAKSNTWGIITAVMTIINLLLLLASFICLVITLRKLLDYKSQTSKAKA
jgi:hypothetical protein